MTAESYLLGFGILGDGVQHIRFRKDFEMYVDDRKAILRVAAYRDGEFAFWREQVFTHPIQRQMKRKEIAMLLMSDEVEDLGSERIELDGRQMCDQCDGFGTKTDMDGDDMKCAYCDGQGWY